MAHSDPRAPRRLVLLAAAVAVALLAGVCALEAAHDLHELLALAHTGRRRE